MQLDDRAINFIQNAKAQGFSKEQVAQFLQDKGYDMGISNNTPQQQGTKDPYSALDKAKYTLRAGGEGLTFGLGDVVAGLTNANIAPVVYALETIKGNKKFDLNDYNPLKNFKEGRKDFVNEQEAFAKAHPALNFGSELGGGLITGALGAGKTMATKAAQSLAKPTLWNMVKAGAKGGLKSGWKFGGAYGFGSGLTQDADELSIKNALLGAGTGAVGGGLLGAGIGGALPVGIAGAVGTWNLGKKAVGKVADILKNKTINKLLGANKEIVEQSIREGKPLLDIADRQLLDVAEGANMLNSKAKQTFADYGEQRLENQHPKLVETLSEYFDPRGSHELLDEIKANTLKGSNPLYRKSNFITDAADNLVLDAQGKPIGKLIPEFETIQGEDADLIMKYIAKAHADEELGREIKGLPQNDMRVLDAAKKALDQRITKLDNQGKTESSAILKAFKARFIGKLDKANPDYKAARAFYESGKRAEDALALGKSALKGQRSDLSYDYNKLTPQEKFFFRQGVGNALEELSNQNADGGNIFKKVFGAETRRRLRTLDIPNYNNLEKFAKSEMKAASNINTLRGGSPTKDRIEIVKRFAKRPYKMAKALAIDTVFKPFAASPVEVSQAMTNPAFLAELYARSQKKTIPNNTIVSILKPRTANGGAVGITANKINDILQEQEAK